MIDHAVTLAGERSSSGPALLLEKSRLHRSLGQPEAALQALSWIDRHPEKPDLRLLLRIEIERGGALCDLGRHREVEKLSTRVRKAAESFPRERSRLLCVEGRVAAGLGRLEEAASILQRAHADPDERAVADLALLTLEIAPLYAREGKDTELKGLGEQALRFAASSFLGREAAATLKLVGRLAAEGKLSTERAVQFASDFSRASLMGTKR